MTAISKPNMLWNVNTKEKEKNMDTNQIIVLVCKAVGLAMGVASIVMGFIPNTADMDTHITLLGVGLAALGVASLMKEK